MIPLAEKLPFPSFQELTITWSIFLLFGIMLGFQLRDVVFKADPSNSLIALDWGILVGSIIFYIFRFAA